MTRVIKLTCADGYTRRGMFGETLWLPVGTLPPTLSGSILCRAGVYHAYRSPEVAAMMDPIHAVLLPGGLAWWAETPEIIADDCTKVGCRELVLVEAAELPVLSTAARVRAAIYCAQINHSGKAWAEWAARWLSGEDRSAASAEAAADADEFAAGALEAAWAAGALAAAWAAGALDAAWAAGALEVAELAAARAAKAAAKAAAKIDLTEIVQRAIRDEEAIP